MECRRDLRTCRNARVCVATGEGIRLYPVKRMVCIGRIAAGTVEEPQTKALVAELKKHGVRHETLFFREEGHGLLDPRNDARFLLRLEQFLAANL